MGGEAARPGPDGPANKTGCVLPAGSGATAARGADYGNDEGVRRTGGEAAGDEEELAVAGGGGAVSGAVCGADATAGGALAGGGNGHGGGFAAPTPGRMAERGPETESDDPATGSLAGGPARSCERAGETKEWQEEVMTKIGFLRADAIAA
jgi:hypothetical protein